MSNPNPRLLSPIDETRFAYYQRIGVYPAKGGKLTYMVSAIPISCRDFYVLDCPQIRVLLVVIESTSEKFATAYENVPGLEKYLSERYNRITWKQPVTRGYLGRLWAALLSKINVYLKNRS